MVNDEVVTYPAYEKAMKHDLRNVCVHKGVLPADFDTIPGWEYSTVADVGNAAQDWPDLNFVIYHAGFKMMFDLVGMYQNFEKTGEIPWVDDLCEVPTRYNVSNAYADIGLCFGAMAITYPRMAAAFVAKLIKGLGADHVLWGTDSIWFGSPQWQIEALRRLEVPEDLQEKYGLAPLGPADGPVKNGIFGLNTAPLYGIKMTDDGHPTENFDADELAKRKAAYEESGAQRDNLYWGWIQDQDFRSS